MSMVTTVVIISDGYCGREEKRLKKLNKWVKDNNHAGGIFEPVKDDGRDSAGTKYPERRLYWGGFNYLDQDQFIEFFNSLGWENTLLIMGYDDSDRGYIVSAAPNLKSDLHDVSAPPIKIYEKE